MRQSKKPALEIGGFKDFVLIAKLLKVILVSYFLLMATEAYSFSSGRFEKREQRIITLSAFSTVNTRAVYEEFAQVIDQIDREILIYEEVGLNRWGPRSIKLIHVPRFDYNCKHAPMRTQVQESYPSDILFNTRGKMRELVREGREVIDIFMHSFTPQGFPELVFLIHCSENEELNESL